MLKTLSNWSMRLFKKDALSQENSALRAKVAEMESSLCRYREGMEFCSGFVTELLAALEELAARHGVEVQQLKRYRYEGLWDGNWYGNLNLSQQKLVSIYIAVTELREDIQVNTAWAGSMVGWLSQSTITKPMSLG